MWGILIESLFIFGIYKNNCLDILHFMIAALDLYTDTRIQKIAGTSSIQMSV